MKSIFGHIVQKRLSQETENVATEALTFVLESSKAARSGMLKLIRGIVPEVPDVSFLTQLADGASRPDMSGMDASGKVHVLIENKFWAGLTENQPVSYLRLLARQMHPHPSLLLVIAPAERTRVLAAELSRRLAAENISWTEVPAAPGVVFQFSTSLGPVLAVTSWDRTLSYLDLETAAEPAARSDLSQLRSLCEAIDDEAFSPFSAQALSDQSCPAFILKLCTLIQDITTGAVAAGVMNCKRLNPQADFRRIGRYAYLGSNNQSCVWFGVHFEYWSRHGRSPLWVVFSDQLGRAAEVAPLLEPWAAQAGVLSIRGKGEFVIALDLPVGAEKEAVIIKLIAVFREIGKKVSGLPANSLPPVAPASPVRGAEPMPCPAASES